MTVAIPWYGSGPALQHCVESVLAQTHKDIHVVVVGDGLPPPLDFKDPRLTVWHTDTNRGTYYVRQVMLLAVPHRWVAPVDADDCLSPDHIERLAEHLGPADMVAPNRLCAHTGRCEHAGGEGTLYGTGRYHVGLFRRSRLLEVGGYDASQRLGQDTLLLRTLKHLYPHDMVTVVAPTYHRMRHPNSLTRAPATNHKSPARKAVKLRNRVTLHAIGRLHGAAAVRRYRDGLLPVDVAEALAQDVERLKARL